MTPRSSRGRALGLRRAVLVAAALLALVACASDKGAPPGSPPPPAATPSASTPAGPEGEGVDLSDQLQPLERDYGAIVGVYAIDLATGTEVVHREDERFAYASTIKALAAAAVLDRLGPGELDDAVTFSTEELVPYSPVTEEHVAGGMTWREIIDAAIRHSDNTAGNLLLERLGGPEGLQEALRESGDRTTVVSRWEPELNGFAPGDDRDTTTARALATSLGRYTAGDELEAPERDLLLEAMRQVRTGDATIRAGVPPGWQVANKTGTGAHGTRNDVALLSPEDGTGPVVLAVLTRSRAADGEHEDALLAEVTTIALEALNRGG